MNFTDDDARQIGDIVSKRFSDDFKKSESDAKHRLEEHLDSFDKFARESRERFEGRLATIEERMTRDVRTRVFSIALAIVSLAAAGMLLGTFTATREVNNSVIALQKDIIGAQTTIKESNKALTDQKTAAEAALKSTNDALVDQRGKLAEAVATLKTTTSELTDSREQVKSVSAQLEKARNEYDTLAKATKALQQKPQTP